MSFLRWAGSKKQIGETVAHCWHAAQAAGGTGRYIEAFCGSASIFFRIQPRRGILVDVNRELMGCFREVRDRPDAVAQLLSKYRKGEHAYYAARSATPKSPLEAAARFIYLNRFCFNGLYRTNSSGEFNVPYGGRRCGSLPTRQELLEASGALARSKLRASDFEMALRDEVRVGDFVYLDPPYAKRNHSLDLQYGPDVFGLSDLRRLYGLLSDMDKAGIYFLFSYAECSEVKDFTRRWHVARVEVQRSIAASAAKRGRAGELLISNI